LNAALPSFSEALHFWHRLGWISFGGPAGQIAIMHAELVERRRWVDEATFLRGLNFCMLLPGPEAMQLATWLGWRLHGLRGGIAAGALFVLPACFVLALLSWIYLRFGEVPAVAGALFGVQAAVLGVLLAAIQRIAARVLKTPLAFGLAGAALLMLALGLLPFPVVILAAAAVGAGVQRWAPHWLPRAHAANDVGRANTPHPGKAIARAFALAGVLLLTWWLPIFALRLWLGPDSTAFAQGLFFSQAALVTFGGAYAVLPYVAQHAVEVHGWLDASQMLVGLGLAESTPGPLVIVLEFVGFVGAWQHPDLTSPLASALLGATVTVWATFLPSFLFVLPAAPWIEALGRHPRLDAALSAITAAVVGVIANLALWFGWHLLRPLPPATLAIALLLAALAWYGMTRWRWRVEAIVLGAAFAGALAQAVGMLSRVS
jgi:chromate transporter